MTLPDAIQRLLIATLAAGSTVSGTELAQRLGISRAAVWKRMKILRDLGLPILASAGAGYRLHQAFTLLDGVAIQQRLSASAQRHIETVDVVWQVDSTNTSLMQLARQGTTAPKALLAEFQSGGRGRRGRVWRSNVGGSLTLSLLWHFQKGMSELSGLSLVAGIAAIQALDDMGIGAVALKWPNDLTSSGRKLAGILIELGGEAQGPCYTVIGVGINLRLDSGTAAEIEQEWTDIASLSPDLAPIDRNVLASALLSRLAESLERFETQGFAGFSDAQSRYDALRGRAVRVTTPSGERYGVACGVDARGALRVRDDAGEFLVESGEVSVRAA